MRVVIYLSGTKVKLEDCFGENDEIEAVVTNKRSATTFLKSSSNPLLQVHPWIDGTIYIDADITGYSQGLVLLKYRMRKDGVWTEWYEQPILFHR